jgi:protein translocase subunit yajC
MLDSVEKGNKVVTNGGLHGTVEGLDGSILIVKIADNVKVKIEKSAIANIVGVTDKK